MYVETGAMTTIIGSLIGFVVGFVCAMIYLFDRVNKIRKQIETMCQRLHLNSQVHIEFNPEDEELGCSLLKGVISSKLEDGTYSIDTKELLRVITLNRYLKKEVL